MEEIDLKELLNYFLSKKYYIILCMIVCVLGGMIYVGFIRTPLYQSDTTIILTKENETNQITSNDITLNQSLVDTYSEIIKSRKVIGTVINNLKLNYSISQLSSLVSVSSVNDTEIIKIVVTNEDPELAASIANEITSVFNGEIVKLYNIQNMGVVDVAEAATKPYNMNILKQLVIYVLFGLVLSFGVLFMLFYFDDTVKSVEEIEKKLGVPVIGKIGKIGRMGGKYE